MTERHASTSGRRRGTRRVGGLLGSILDPAARARGFAASAILAEWPTVVGPGLAMRCRPVQVRFERGRNAGGTLLLEARGGAALELQHATPQILERINRFFGFAAVRTLRFRPSPMWRPPTLPAPPSLRPLDAAELQAIAGAVDPIEDPGLRGALVALGAVVRARRPAPR